MKRTMKLMTPEQVRSILNVKKVCIGLALTCLGGIVAALILKIVEVKEAEEGEEKLDA